MPKLARVLLGAALAAALATPMAKELHVQAPPNGCTTSVAPFFCNYVIKIIKTLPKDTPPMHAIRIDITGPSWRQHVAKTRAADRSAT